MTDQFQLSTRFYDLAVNTAANAVTYLEGDRRQQILEALHQNVEKYAQVEEKLERLREITSRYASKSRGNEEVQEETSSRDEGQSLHEKYEDEVGKIEVNVGDNKHLRNFNVQVKQLISSYGGEGTSQDDGDEEMTVTANINVICPISKTRMKEPMKNKICGHIYDKESVLAMIKVNVRSRCPVVGCSNKEFLSMAHMNTDIVTKVYLEKNP